MRGIRDAIFAEVKQSGNKAEPNIKLKQVKQHIHDWPSSYQRRNHPYEPRPGEAIIGELDGVVDIIGYYLSQLHDTDNRKKKPKFNWESGGKFDKKQLQFFQKG